MTIVTDPPEVEVYAGQKDTENPVFIGSTPLELDEDELSKKIKIEPEKFSFLELSLKKSGYESEKIWLPSRGWDSQHVTVKVQLKESGASGSQLDLVLQYILNAQKFAETRQFEQAHMALDEALKIAPKFARAASMKAGVFFLQKSYDQSRIWYRRTLELNPGHTEAVKMLDQITKLTN